MNKLFSWARRKAVEVWDALKLLAIIAAVIAFIGGLWWLEKVRFVR